MLDRWETAASEPITYIREGRRRVDFDVLDRGFPPRCPLAMVHPQTVSIARVGKLKLSAGKKSLNI